IPCLFRSLSPFSDIENEADLVGHSDEHNASSNNQNEIKVKNHTFYTTNV
ncbi:unnamed protein product, partial [Rotaria magnacalcarata]